MLDRLFTWLIAHEYTEMSVYKHWSTVRRGVSTSDPLSLLASVDPSTGKPRTKAALHQARFALECWADFLKDSGDADVGDLILEQIAAWVESNKKPRRGGRGRGRKVVKVGLPTDQWRALRKHVAEKTGADATVVQMLLRTGLRISDVLRIPRATVEEGVRTGEMKLKLKGGKVYPYPADPVRQQLEELLAHDGWVIVYELVTRGNLVAGGQAVRRKLKVWGAEIGIEDVYPHKLRRTTITELDERFGRKTAQQLAGHEDANTTGIYTRRMQPTDRVGAKLTAMLDEEE
jgi:integrase